MKKLSDILYKVRIQSVNGATDILVNDIQIDSRRVKQGSVFIAIKGEKFDGHDFIEKAIGLGVSAIVCEVMPSHFQEGITYIQVSNPSEAAGYIAHNFYDEPSQKFRLVGVTGTNGKTTIAMVLFKLFTELGYRCGLVSTVENKIVDKIRGFLCIW